MFKTKSKLTNPPQLFPFIFLCSQNYFKNMEEFHFLFAFVYRIPVPPTYLLKPIQSPPQMICFWFFLKPDLKELCAGTRTGIVNYDGLGGFKQQQFILNSWIGCT